MPCKVYLIKGNHDKKSQAYYESFGITVINYPVYITSRVLLSHYPHKCSSSVLNLHGHLHCSNLDLNNYFNLNIHMCDYQLISEKQVERMLLNIPKNKLENKFTYEWYIGHQVYDIKYKDRLCLTEDGHVDIIAERERLNSR